VPCIPCKASESHPGALLFALFGSDVVAGSGESDPCEFTGFNLASMGQIKKCSSDKVLKIVVSGEFGLASNADVHEIVVDGGKNCAATATMTSDRWAWRCLKS
jgi:hypothetical protein